MMLLTNGSDKYGRSKHDVGVWEESLGFHENFLVTTIGIPQNKKHQKYKNVQNSLKRTTKKQTNTHKHTNVRASNTNQPTNKHIHTNRRIHTNQHKPKKNASSGTG